jgi:Putative zinc-finger
MPPLSLTLHKLTHVLSCKEASLLLSEAEDRRLSLVERWKLRLHLSLCDACTRFSRHIAFLRKAMQRYRE